MKATQLRARFSSLIDLVATIKPHERRAVTFAFLCNFILLGSYYILRPLRDTMATIFGVAELQNLFTATFVLIFLCAPFFSWCAAKFQLAKILPGVFWFLLGNLFLFYCMFRIAPHSRWLAATYFCWFSSFNLILISVFWAFMADIFSPSQATRLYALVAAGGSIGAIVGAVVTASLAQALGVDGLLLVAMGGFFVVVLLIQALIHEKNMLRIAGEEAQKTTLDHNLPGNPFRGFSLLFRSAYMMAQAAFMLLMTWIATILYFMQTDLIAQAYSTVERRTVAFADVDLFVNAGSAIILIFGLSNLLRKRGVTISLVLSPLIMLGASLMLFASPTLFMVQTARALQRISQYGIARPSREILFTVVDQQSKYKAKNVIDTVVYRFGDLTAAWMQAGLRAWGFGFVAVVCVAVGISALWGAVAVELARRYHLLAGGDVARKLVVAAS